MVSDRLKHAAEVWYRYVLNIQYTCGWCNWRNI